MKILGHKVIEELIESKSPHCISIYLPIHRLGDQQDAIRYKNLLGEAEKLLKARGMRSSEAAKLLAPEYELADVVEYWAHLGADGLAVFLDDKRRERYPVPRNVGESVSVDGHFRVKPLIPLVTGDGSFFLLALSKGRIRLFLGSRFSMAEAELPESIAKSLAEAMRYDDPQKQLQFHTGTGGPGGERPAMFHGHGVGIDEEEENVRRFLQQLEKKLTPLFLEENIPVVLAGLEPLPALYRKFDSSGMLLPETININPGAMNSQTLHELAWLQLGPFFAEGERRQQEKFSEMHGTGKTSTDMATILDSAAAGRIETLFVEEDEEYWGLYDPENHKVDSTPEDLPGSADLLDLALAGTLKNDGTVYVKKEQEMPVAGKIAALLRY